MTQCKSGYYGSGTQCISCHPSCSVCYDGNHTSCFSCNSGYYFSNNACLPCASNCATCYGPAVTQCYSCTSGIQIEILYILYIIYFSTQLKATTFWVRLATHSVHCDTTIIASLVNALNAILHVANAQAHLLINVPRVTLETI